MPSSSEGDLAAHNRDLQNVAKEPFERRIALRPEFHHDSAETVEADEPGTCDTEHDVRSVEGSSEAEQPLLSK